MKILFISLFLLIFMNGCFTHEIPTCSDAKVQKSVKTLYIQILQNVQDSGNPFLAGYTDNLPQTIESLSNIKTVSYDELIQLKRCTADALFENNQTLSIEYTIEINDESSDDLYIELNTEFLEGLMQQRIMEGVFNK